MANTTIWIILLSLTLTAGAAFSCRSDDPDLPVISGHNVNLAGVAHAPGMEHAERYCQLCHGVALAGGEELEPSCYQCHGRNWDEDDPLESRAPADHTTDNGGYFHHPALREPVGTCESCHGQALRGGVSDNPGCYTCHLAVWNTD